MDDQATLGERAGRVAPAPTVLGAIGLLVAGAYAALGIVAGIRYGASQLWPGAYGYSVGEDRSADAAQLALVVGMIGAGLVLGGTVVAALRGSVTARWIVAAVMAVIAVVAALLASPVGAQHRCIRSDYSGLRECTGATTAYLREALLYALPAALTAVLLGVDARRSRVRAAPSP